MTACARAEATVLLGGGTRAKLLATARNWSGRNLCQCGRACTCSRCSSGRIRPSTIRYPRPSSRRRRRRRRTACTRRLGLRSSTSPGRTARKYRHSTSTSPRRSVCSPCGPNSRSCPPRTSCIPWPHTLCGTCPPGIVRTCFVHRCSRICPECIGGRYRFHSSIYPQHSRRTPCEQCWTSCQRCTGSTSWRVPVPKTVPQGTACTELDHGSNTCPPGTSGMLRH